MKKYEPALWLRAGFEAVWVMATIQRLPEAAGPRRGRFGSGKPLRLLVLGDSAAAGVGVDTQDDALVGQLVGELQTTYDVSWELLAKSGATTGSCLQFLQEHRKYQLDAVVISIGLNDVKNGVSFQVWRQNMRKILATLQADYGNPTIYVSALPPVREFRALPPALRELLGKRRDYFDNMLRRLARQTNRTFFLPYEFDFSTADLAADGFHPGRKTYALWAQIAASAVKERH